MADPVRLARAVGQSGAFFNEVLAYKMISEIKPNMTKAKSEKVKATKKSSEKEKEKKDLSMEEKFSEYDAVMEAYLSKF